MTPPLIDMFIVPEVPSVLYALFDYGLTEKQAIYNEMLKMNIMGDLDLNKGKECMVEPPSRTEWVIQLNGETKEISYNSYCDYPPDVLNLIKLQDYIHTLVSSKKEYLDLPVSNGYYE